MKYLFLTTSLILILTSFSQAKITTPQITAACMQLDNGTPSKCSCMAKKFGQNLNDKENTYALAMMTLNEKMLEPYKGSFTDKTTDSVKAKIIPLMMDCLL